MSVYNPVAGLRTIHKSEIEPGDEVVWTWNGSQIIGSTYYVHAILPLIDADDEWGRKKQQTEFDFIISRDRTFYLVKKYSQDIM